MFGRESPSSGCKEESANGTLVVDERQNTSGTIKNRHGTSRNVEERLGTSRNVEKRPGTSWNVEERRETSARQETSFTSEERNPVTRTRRSTRYARSHLLIFGCRFVASIFLRRRSRLTISKALEMSTDNKPVREAGLAALKPRVIVVDNGSNAETVER